jgi:Family of unknown function (DUF6516)
LAERSFGKRIAEIRAVLYPQPFQKRLRSKSPTISTGQTGRSVFLKTPGLPFVKPDEMPRGIVFRDDSFLVLYEEWSFEDELLSYKYHYQRPDGWFVRYDMDKEEKPGHPKHHLQASPLDEGVRLPTGEVRCEAVLRMIAEQFVHLDR